MLNSSCNKALKKIYLELQIAINIIRKLVKKCKKIIETRRTEKEQIEIEQEIEKINQKTELSIIILGTLWSEQLQEELTR